MEVERRNESDKEELLISSSSSFSSTFFFRFVSVFFFRYPISSFITSEVQIRQTIKVVIQNTLLWELILFLKIRRRSWPPNETIENINTEKKGVKYMREAIDLSLNFTFLFLNYIKFYWMLLKLKQKSHLYEICIFFLSLCIMSNTIFFLIYKYFMLQLNFKKNSRI